MRRVLQEVYSPTAGLDYRIPDTVKNVRNCTNILNMRLADGEVTSDWGYTIFGGNQPLLGIPCKIDVYQELDGDLHALALTTKYIYEYDSTSQDWNVVSRGTVVEDCEDTWTACPVAFTHIKCNDNTASTTVTDSGTGTNACTSSVNTSNLSVAGKINTAFELDGSEYVTIDAVASDIVSDNTGSFSLWAKATGTAVGSATFLGFGDTDSTPFLLIAQNADDLRVKMLIDGSNDITWTVTNAFDDTDWHHVVVIQNGTALAIYVDGSDVTPTPAINGSGNADWWFDDLAGLDNGSIGCLDYNSIGNQYFFTGTLDDIRYYKAVLTSTEVATIYNTANGTENSINVCAVSSDAARGTYSVSTSVHALFTTGIASYETISSTDVSGDTHLYFWIKSNIATAAGDLQIGLSEEAAGGEGATYARYNVPALTAGTWTHVELDLASPDDSDGGTYPDDLNAVLSVYLYVVTDNGAQVINVDDIRTLKQYTGDYPADGWSSCVHDNGQYFATNYDDVIQRKDEGANFADSGWSAAYQGKDIQSFKGHVVLLNTKESGNPNPCRVRWSISGALAYADTDWTNPTSGFSDKLYETSGHIVKSEFLGNELIIYKEDAIYAMSWIGGTSIYRLDQRVSGLGLISSRAIVRRRGLHYFLGTDYNVYMYDGTNEPYPVGDQIKRHLASQISTEYTKYCIIQLDNDYDEIRVGTPTGTNDYTDTWYIYNFKEQNWSRSTREWTAVGTHQSSAALTLGTLGGTIGAQTITLGEASTKNLTRLYLMSDENGYIYKLDRTTVNLNGAAQERYFDTIDFTLRGSQDEDEKPVSYIYTLKRILKSLVEGKGNSISIYYSLDGGSSWLPAPDTYQHTLTSTYSKYTSDFDTSVPLIRLRFYNNTLSSSMAFRWFALQFLVTAEDQS